MRCNVTMKEEMPCVIPVGSLAYIARTTWKSHWIVSQWNTQSRNSRLAFVTFVFDHCSGSARGCPWIWIHNCATTFYTAPTFDKPHPARAKRPTFGSKFKFEIWEQQDCENTNQKWCLNQHITGDFWNCKTWKSWKDYFWGLMVSFRGGLNFKASCRVCKLSRVKTSEWVSEWVKWKTWTWIMIRPSAGTFLNPPSGDKTRPARLIVIRPSIVQQNRLAMLCHTGCFFTGTPLKS